MPRHNRRKKDAVEHYFDKHFAQQTRLNESDVILNPASYNQKGLLGDFEVCLLGYDHLVPVSGRTGPYTSIPEWFDGAGILTLEKEPDYALALLYTDQNQSRAPSSQKSPNDLRLLYHITRHDGLNLKNLVDHFQPVQIYTPGERIVT